MPDNLQADVYYDIGHGKPVSFSSKDPDVSDAVSYLVPALKPGEAFHVTALEDNPWMLVDLESEMCISRVKIFGPDRNFNQVLPLCLEFALNDKVFKPILTQFLHFGGRTVDYPISVEFPWKLHLRYLKISVPRRTRLFLDYIEISIRIPVFNTGRLIDLMRDKEGVSATYAHHQSYGFSWTFTLTLIAVLESHRRGVKVRDVDFSRALAKFKNHPNDDPYKGWFQPGGEPLSLDDMRNVPKYQHHGVYAALDLKGLCTYARRYFLPSLSVIRYCDELQRKYSVDPDNCCVIFYRGTDKHVEVTPVNIDEYINMALSIISSNKNGKVIIQTDQQQIRDYVIERIPDAVVFGELPVTGDARAIHNHNVQDIFGLTPAELGFRLLAITYFVSRCRYLITHTGNMGVWAAIYRSNSEGLYQACSDGIWRGPNGKQVNIDDPF